jgi:exosome complex component RRP42
MSTSISPSERSYIISGLLHPTSPTRIDSRSLLQPRPISISYGDAPQANGSARVTVDGGTEVIAGIRLEVGDVYEVEGKGKGKEGWRGTVEVDV